MPKWGSDNKKLGKKDSFKAAVTAGFKETRRRASVVSERVQSVKWSDVTGFFQSIRSKSRDIFNKGIKKFRAAGTDKRKQNVALDQMAKDFFDNIMTEHEAKIRLQNFRPEDMQDLQNRVRESVRISVLNKNQGGTDEETIDNIFDSAETVVEQEIQVVTATTDILAGIRKSTGKEPGPKTTEALRRSIRNSVQVMSRSDFEKFVQKQANNLSDILESVVKDIDTSRTDVKRDSGSILTTRPKMDFSGITKSNPLEKLKKTAETTADVVTRTGQKGGGFLSEIATGDAKNRLKPTTASKQQAPQAPSLLETINAQRKQLKSKVEKLTTEQDEKAASELEKMFKAGLSRMAKPRPKSRPPSTDSGEWEL